MIFERMLVIVAATIAIAITVDALYMLPPQDWFFNECHYSVNQFVCWFSWRKFIQGVCLFLYGYVSWVIIENARNLNKSRGR